MGQHDDSARNVNLAGFSGYPSGPGFLKFPRTFEVSCNRSLAWSRGMENVLSVLA